MLRTALPTIADSTDDVTLITSYTLSLRNRQNKNRVLMASPLIFRCVGSKNATIPVSKCA
jgi:hypothetical protein